MKHAHRLKLPNSTYLNHRFQNIGIHAKTRNVRTNIYDVKLQTISKRTNKMTEQFIRRTQTRKTELNNLPMLSTHPRTIINYNITSNKTAKRGSYKLRYLDRKFQKGSNPAKLHGESQTHHPNQTSKSTKEHARVIQK